MIKNNYVLTLSKEQISLLKEIMIKKEWVLDRVPYSFWRARKDKTSATAYESGKVSIQGRGTQDLVQFIIEPYILKEVRFGYELTSAKESNPDMFKPHAGIDESGKGDYFGPLVVASAYVDSTTAVQLFEIGVQDSKSIGSDKKIKTMANEIKKIIKGQYSLVSIGPESYNRMYKKIGNVNKLLAWGHSRVLENLLQKQPNCSRAISDQFASKSTVLNSLLEKGRKIKLDQWHRAESDIAVAAASILARQEFLRKLEELAKMAETKLPKGASAKVIETAASIINKEGLEKLNLYAKLHFQTTKKAEKIAESIEKSS